MSTSHRLLFSVSLIFLIGCNSQQNRKATRVSPAPAQNVAGEQASKPTDPAVLARVKKLANECGEATLKGNYRRVLELTPDNVVNAMGGKEQAITILTQALDEMARNGTSFLSYEIGEPGDLHTLGQNTFIVVPSVVKMKANGKNIVMRGYLLGLSTDQSATWKFYDNNALEDPNLRKLVPPLPASLKIPAPEEPKITE